MTNRFLVLLLLSVTTLAASAADVLRFESPATRVALLELYTSEGCSSCPPADRFLSKLEGDDRLWSGFIPVAFHVNYWDYIGWPDRFAEATYGERQREYRRTGHIASVYTPGLVLGGQEWRSWFVRPELTLPTPARVGALSAAVEDSRVSARFQPAVALDDRLLLHVAVLGFDLYTEVAAGENEGKRLEHDFVVLGYRQVRLNREGAEYQATAALPDLKVEAPKKALVAWVSGTRDPRPLQAAGGWLQ